jgi:hypothetical protein
LRQAFASSGVPRSHIGLSQAAHHPIIQRLTKTALDIAPYQARRWMAVPMSKGVRAPAEQLYRAVIKHVFLNQEPANDGPLPAGRLKHERLLPPYFGEMGFEIRYHLAQVEPWLRHGWKVVTRRPAFYPQDSAIAAPESPKRSNRCAIASSPGCPCWTGARPPVRKPTP